MFIKKSFDTVEKNPSITHFLFKCVAEYKKNTKIVVIRLYIVLIK